MRFLKRWRRKMEQVKTAVFGTKRIMLTRSILLDGGHQEGKEGEVRDLPIRLADDLILMGSAVACDAPITKQKEEPRAKAEMRPVKLLKSIMLSGVGEGAAGEVHKVPIHIAYSLIDDGAAQPCGWVAQPLEMRGPIC